MSVTVLAWVPQADPTSRRVAAVIGPVGPAAWVGMAETDNPDTGQPYIPEPTVPAMVEYFGEQAGEVGAAAGAAAAQAATAALQSDIDGLAVTKQDAIFVFPMNLDIEIDSGSAVLLSTDMFRRSIRIELVSNGSGVIISTDSNRLPSAGDRLCQTLLPKDGKRAYFREGPDTPKGIIRAASLGGRAKIKITVENTTGIDPRMADFLSRFPVMPTGGVMDAIKAFYSEIGALGLLDIGQNMFVTAAENEPAAKIDWIGSGLIVPHGGITHQGLAGYVGNGTDGYLTTGAILPFGRYKLDDACMFCDIGNDLTTNNSMWVMGYGGGGILANRDTSNGGRWQFRANQPLGNPVLPLGLGGFGGWSRSSSAQYTAYRETISTPVNIATELQNQNELLLCAINGASSVTGFSNHPLRLAFVGGAISAEQVEGLRVAFSRYITAMGIALA